MSPKNSQYQSSVNEFNGSLHTDNMPMAQPKGSHRFALNIVDKTDSGDYNSKSNEQSNYPSTPLPSNFVPLGKIYTKDNTNVLILKNKTNGREHIALLDKNNTYTVLVDTTILGLDVRYMCQIEYRLRRGNEEVIYWVDAKNRARVFSLTKPYNFYNKAYSDYLKAGGDPLLFTDEKWDESSFNLVKSYRSIPFFSTIDIVESGSIVPGSYNFAIQYVDEDLNPTEWITTSNIARIFNDSLGNSYERIRGSRGNTTISQNFPRANKSIRLQITNLDKDFPYYRVAIIPATDGLAIATKAYASDLYSTQETNFVYTGNDGELTNIDLADILVDKEIIFAPHHITQLENRLVLSYTKGNNVKWCEFQKYASKIRTDLVTKQTILNDVKSKPNSKNVNSTFVLRGYMPGEVYSLGIVYVTDDGESPVCTIPGKNKIDSVSKMAYHELDNKYLPIHGCTTDDYWGRDYSGENLVNNPIRHHRFPFRKQVNKPLVTTVDTNFSITKYKLVLVVSINPDYTPTPEYPDGTDGFPLQIPYQFTYQVTGAPNPSTIAGTLTKEQATTIAQIILYDDTDPLDILGSTNYADLDLDSALGTYQDGSNDLFIISTTYTPYITTSTTSVDTSEIFGIQISNIEKPHPSVTGFYIVRNERLDDDRLIVDTGFFGPTTTFNEYISFGLPMAKQYYPVNNCGRFDTSPKTLQYSNKASWFFSPEYHFLQKEIEFDKVEVEGIYEEQSVNMPTGCSGLYDSNRDYGTKGVYINDVQAGTSFNPDINKNKDKDDDGFDLIIGYRNTNIKYLPNNTLVFPVKSRIVRLSATAHQNFGNNIYYNVSTDNRISMLLTDGTYDTNVFYNTTTKKNSLVYGALFKNNTSSYSNFISRPYYKEHNNPVLFGTLNVINNVDIYNGDVEIGAMNFVSTVFNDMVVADRAKKSRVWQIIAGVVLVVVGVLASIYTAGTSLALVATGLGSLAISYGISLAVAGVKFEQFKKMIDEDYEKGLRETVSDGGVFETIRNNIGLADDTIRWFADRVSNIYMETTVPIALRVGSTAGISDFIDAPAPYNEEAFKVYLTEKLTLLDRDQGAGRLYKGFASAEFYDANKDYMRFNKQKEYIHLPIEYDCCSDEAETYPVRNWYSEQSFQEELVDNYRAFLPNNYKDIEGQHGEITNTYRLGNTLMIQTREALWELPPSLQEKVVGELVATIGTGAFFSIPTRKMLDTGLGGAGSTHKWGTIKTPQGVLSISEIEHAIYIHGAKLQDITIGNKEWFRNNLVGYLDAQFYRKFGFNYPNNNNPVNANGTGYISIYDDTNNRIIITKKDYQILPALFSIMTLTSTIPTSGVAFVYCLLDGNFYSGSTLIYLTNADYFENKSWTISYSFNRMGWQSWHSYLPNFYIQTQDTFFSYVFGVNSLWKHNRVGHFQTYYGKLYPCIIEYVKMTNPLRDSSFEDILLQTIARIYDFTNQQWIDQRFVTFTSLLVYNSRQNNGEQALIVKETQANLQNYYQQQVTNTSKVILISKKGRDWHINGGLRDYVIDPTKSLFSKNWQDIKDNYFIDKVINPTSISFTKKWYELESFKDKYAIVRLKFDTFDDVNLILNYSIQTEEVTD